MKSLEIAEQGVWVGLLGLEINKAVLGGTILGEKGFAAFWAVLVVLPPIGGGIGNFELLNLAWTVPLALGWVLEQGFTGRWVLSSF